MMEKNAHREFIRSLNLVSEVHVVDKSKKIEDRNNPLEPINKVHRYLKEFLSSHGGYSRDTLQDWLNLFAFIYNNKGKQLSKSPGLYRDGYQNAYKIALFEVVKQGKQRLKLIYHSLGCK